MTRCVIATAIRLPGGGQSRLPTCGLLGAAPPVRHRCRRRGATPPAADRLPPAVFLPLFRKCLNATAAVMVAMLWACSVVPPVEVARGEEQLQDGPLRLVQREMHGSLSAAGLVLTVPALAQVPALPTAYGVAIRRQDGTVVTSGTARAVANQPMILTLGMPDQAFSLPQYADMIVHLQADALSWQLRARTSLLPVLAPPQVAVQAPPTVAHGASFVVAVAAPPQREDLSVSVTDPLVISGPAQQAPGGMLVPVQAGTAGGGDAPAVNVLAVAGGAPRRLAQQLSLAPGPSVQVVLGQMAAAPGGWLDVLVMPAPLPGAVAGLEDDTGAVVARASVEPVADAAGLARLYVPLDAPAASPALSLWVQDAGGQVLHSRRVPLGLNADLPARLAVQAASEAGRVTVTLTATDAANAAIPGAARMQVMEGPRLVADAQGTLGPAGTYSFTVPMVALLGPGQQAGMLHVLASVVAMDGRAASRMMAVGLGGDALRVWVPHQRCTAGQTCLLDVWVNLPDGTGVASAQGAVTLPGNDAVVLFTDAAGRAQVVLPARAAGFLPLVVDACAGPLCGHARAVVVVTPQRRVNVQTVARPVAGAPLLQSVDLPGGGLAALRLEREGQTLWGAIATPSTQVNAPWAGVLRLQQVVVEPTGVLSTHATSLLVEPPPGPVLQHSATADGVTVAAAGGPGAVLLAQADCGASELTGWPRGFVNVAMDGLLRAGGEASLTQLAPALAADLASPVEVTAEADDPDAAEVRRILQARVREDLLLIVEEARALAAEGSLTATELGRWLARRQGAYVDVFAQRYELGAARGEVFLRSAGPDEMPGNQDDLTATVPLEQLLLAVPPPAAPLPPIRDPPTAAAFAASPLQLWTGPTAQLGVTASCGMETRVRLVGVTAAGQVQAASVPAAALWGSAAMLEAPPVYTLGDKGTVAWGVAGQGGGSLQARGAMVRGGGAGAVGAASLGVGTLAVTGTGLQASAQTTVQPDAASLQVMQLQACTPQPCTFSAQGGTTVAAFASLADVCRHALARLRSVMPAEAAGTALAAAAASDLSSLMPAYTLAVAEAAAFPDQALAVAEVAAQTPLLTTAETAPWLVTLDTWQQPPVTLRTPAVSRAWFALALAPHNPTRARQMANEALASSDSDARALAVQALAAVGQAREADVTAVEALAQSALAHAAVAQAWRILGRRDNAVAALLAAGELLGHPAPLQDQARMAAAWCALAAPLGHDAAPTVTLSAMDRSVLEQGPGSAWFSPTTTRTLTATGAAWRGNATWDATPWSLAALHSQYSNTQASPGGSVAVLTPSPAAVPRGVWRVAVAPGWMAQAGGRILHRDPQGPLWMEAVPGQAASHTLWARHRGSVRAAPVDYWPQHVAARPLTDAPPRLQVH